ncbi:hypothetical protein ACFQFC_26905 [Amorphoplanes digitatis]|uniref:Uncharacterized protein n=1 Tax=Actinoplanes digitatis TaxID=1868 RepID=A0A7W7MMC7_9ACTN|nr:hypothetical protein [Actinoplanes digitatis]MBB4759773.1 hypothetical protein [Actinoplanes digitatis]
MNIDEFAVVASREQAALFSAACAERSSGILFWTVSSSGRPADLDRYVRTLDMLWVPDFEDRSVYESQRRELEGMHEMVVGDELTGPSALALYSVVTLHSALKVIATGSTDAILECSMAARNAAFRAQRRLNVPLLVAEERYQDDDVNDLVTGGGVDSLRVRAQQNGRDRFDLMYAAYSSS